MPLPKNKTQTRPEDMSSIGSLTIFLHDDGDVGVIVRDESGNVADIEFCSIGSGGGHSPATLDALRSLYYAMAEDNK